MATNFIKLIAISFASLLLNGCNPSIIGEEDCDDIGRIAVVENLITITPLKTTYQQGEEVIFKLDVPSQNSYFGNPVDIYQQTNLATGWLITNSLLFDNNILVFTKGSRKEGASNWFNLNYNLQNQMYELEIKVKLNRVGNYQIITADAIDFLGTPRCNRYSIRTKIMGHVDNVINFTVE